MTPMPEAIAVSFVLVIVLIVSLIGAFCRHDSPFRIPWNLMRLAFYLFVTLPVFYWLMWRYWPKRSRQIALGDEPYETTAWQCFSEYARAKNRQKHGGRLTCTECKSYLRRIYHVHHIQYRAHRPDLFLWLPNLRVVCIPCHEDIHRTD